MKDEHPPCPVTSAAMPRAAACSLYTSVEPKIFTLVTARIAIKMTQITSATELHNRIPVSRLTPSPIGCEVVVLMSEADRLPWRCAPLWHFKRMARSKMKQSIGYGRSSSDQNQSAIATRTRTRTPLLKDDEPVR